MDIDRAHPGRPAGKNGGEQRWRQLLFLHWTVPADAMRARVPAGLELDLWEGRAFVGVVPFAMLGVRPSWLPRFAALDFLETNVRTYVVRDGLPGVYFFSLEAASGLAVAAARATFGLPYHHADMSLVEGDGVVDYQTRRRGGTRPRLAVRYRAGAPAVPSVAGTLQHFLVERYHLFVERRRAMWRGQVSHPPYTVADAEVLSVEDELVAAAGLPPAAGPPVHACWSPGVEVEVFRPPALLGSSQMAQASCKRCKELVAGEETECPRCGGPVEDDCTICGKRELRGEELRRCIGCGAWLCGRAQCSRDSYENLAKRATGRVCASCFRKREIVPRTGSGKGAGSAAGVEAVERGRYYIYEATLELEERLRALSLELAERISSLVAGHLERVGDRTLAGTRTAAGELGQALEEALARGLSRGTADLGGRLRMPAILLGLVLVAANAAVTAAVVLALR